MFGYLVTTIKIYNWLTSDTFKTLFMCFHSHRTSPIWTLLHVQRNGERDQIDRNYGLKIIFCKANDSVISLHPKDKGSNLRGQPSYEEQLCSKQSQERQVFTFGWGRIGSRGLKAVDLHHPNTSLDLPIPTLFTVGSEARLAWILPCHRAVCFVSWFRVWPEVATLLMVLTMLLLLHNGILSEGPWWKGKVDRMMMYPGEAASLWPFCWSNMVCFIGNFDFWTTLFWQYKVHLVHSRIYQLSPCDLI